MNLPEALGTRYGDVPFFLVGAVRSGTTVLRLLLGHHPDICRCEEMEFVATPLADWGGKIADMDSYRCYLALDRGFRMSGYRINPDLEFEDLARDFLEQRRKEDGCPIVGATVHNHFDRLLDIWPDAKFIFMSRDPRDVARSCVQMGWAGTAWGGSQFWIDAQDQWERLSARVPATRRHVVRFEDLIASSTEVLKELCAFLGTSYDPAMLDIERDTTYRRPDPAESRSWRDSAEPAEVRQVETRIGVQQIEAAGYAQSGEPPLRMTSFRLAAIWAQDIGVRVRFRAARYGWSLWLAGVVSRRLPVRSWRESVRLRMDAIENQFLK